MENRIRYRNNRSTKNFSLPNGQQVYVTLNLDVDRQFRIMHANTHEQVLAGFGRSPHDVKKQAKKALVEMGVVFTAETRKRKEDASA